MRGAKGDADKAYARVRAVLRQIPEGRVASYGQIAAAAGLKKHARMAGYALYHLPAGTELPWHRVINAQGRISFPPRSAQHRKQRRLLEAEGVVFIGGKISFARYGWRRAASESPLLD